MSLGMPLLSLEPSAATLLGACPPGHPELSEGPSVVVAGRYAVGGVIGVGTYGEVRYAVSLASGERVAIKIVDLARFSADTARLMRKEISILRMLGSHPHCIRILDVHENVPFQGHWCETCACTAFKHVAPSANDAQAQAAPAAPGPVLDHTKPSRRAGPIYANSACGVCGHSASEHAGVAYRDATYASPYTGAEDDEQEDEGDGDGGGGEGGGGETRNVMLIVQELAAGGELFSLLSHSGPLPEEVARLYFQQLISGMAHLHALGIAHRDLKPENLVLDENFSIKIADYGLASLGVPIDPVAAAQQQQQQNQNPYDQHNSTLALTQQMIMQQQQLKAGHEVADPARLLLPEVRHYSGVGSQPYSAPECFYVRELHGGRGYRGAPCDVWSSAVVLYVMLTGRPPFVRPLSKTYGAHMRRCRHFVSMQAGGGMDTLHPLAKDLLQKLLKLNPTERLTVSQIQAHPWFLGPTPSHEELVKIMEERSLKSWTGSHHPEMTQVLSKMRSGRRNHRSACPGEMLSQSQGTTPYFGASQSPSPMMDNSAINSPSFSASSLPASPYVLAMASGTPSALASLQLHQLSARPGSPDSRDLGARYITASPAFPHGRSALLSSTVQQSGASSFLPPPHSARHAHAASSDAAVSAATASPVVTARSSRSGSIFSRIGSMLRVSLLSLNDSPSQSPQAPPQASPQQSPPESENVLLPALPVGSPLSQPQQSEIPPSSPTLHVSHFLAQQQEQERNQHHVTKRQPNDESSTAAAEEEDDARIARKLAQQAQSEGDAAGDQQEEQCKVPPHLMPFQKRVAKRLSRTPPSHSLDCSPVVSAPLLTLPLAVSFSFPPRAAVGTLARMQFHSTLDLDSLRALLEARLQKRGARITVVPPRGRSGDVSVTSAAAALADDEECLLHVSCTHQNIPILALVSIRAVGAGLPGASAAAGTTGAAPRKGRIVVAEKIRATDPAIFADWFNALAVGLREE